MDEQASQGRLNAVRNLSVKLLDSAMYAGLKGLES